MRPLLIMKPTSHLAPEEIEDGREFVDHVNELLKSRFAQRVLAQRVIRLTTKNAWVETKLVNFDEEECQSFLLKCRLLMQDNERISIRRIWSFFKEKVRHGHWFEKINPPRWMLNDYLDRPVLFEGDSGTDVSNRLILETFLYGSYAHLDREHRKRYKQWQADPSLFHLRKLEFLVTLQALLNTATKMASVVEAFLASDAIAADPTTSKSRD